MRSLALQIQQSFRRDPHAGDLYVFRGRRGDLCKILWYDGIGMAMTSSTTPTASPKSPAGRISGARSLTSTRPSRHRSPLICWNVSVSSMRSKQRFAAISPIRSCARSRKTRRAMSITDPAWPLDDADFYRRAATVRYDRTHGPGRAYDGRMVRCLCRADPCADAATGRRRDPRQSPRPQKRQARRCFSSRHTRPTSIRSKWSFPNSRLSCERLPHELLPTCGMRSAMPCRASPKGMRQLLLCRRI